MSTNLSLLTAFDDLWKNTTTFCTNQSCLEEFLRFAASQEECRLKWFDSLRDNQWLKKMLDEAKKDNIHLDSKLNTARKLLDQEKTKRLKAEEERKQIERQLQMVRDLLLDDNRNKIHDETKEKLKFLNSTPWSRASIDYNDRLSAIQELDSTGSMLSDLSYSRSDDDLDLDTVLHKRRPYKKQRPSEVGYNEIPSIKRRRSSHVVELNKEGVPERMVATTTVTVDHDGSMSALSQIETIPSVNNQQPSAPTRCGSMESVESGLSIENANGNTQSTTPGAGVLPIGNNKINLKNHVFLVKTLIRPEACDVCEKRMKFGSSVCRCQNCRALSHPSCKLNLPLPCVAPGSTPVSKKNGGLIADYAPASPPMVPALIQHCIKEIEARGLNEPGIYRVTGSDKEIKALKEKFMKCRGVPRLADVDVHVICGCLKDFLLKLREPLVTFNLWWEFANAAEKKDLEERRSKLYQAISQLPQPNRDTLAFIILHLLRVAEANETNKMPITNLATILGPTVVGYSKDIYGSEAFSQSVKAKLILEQFLAIPADYWYRVMSKPGNIYSTPSIRETVPSRRTPSTRSFKRLFDYSPAH